MEGIGNRALTREQLEAKRAASDANRTPHMRSNAYLRLHVLASGSKGNCSIVENLQTGACVTIDCGISKRAFLERSAACGVDPTRIEAILVTHEHSDHTKGLGVVTRGLAKLGTRPAVFASAAVHAASTHLKEIDDAVDMRHFARGDTLALAGMDVYAFPTLHDAAESFGFRFECANDSIGFMTDTGIVTAEALEALPGCRVLAIEANHDPLMLKYGPYPQHLKERIASEHGHLSNVQSASLLETLLGSELECVIGMHVSENNNNYTLPVDALAQTLQRNDHSAQARVGYQHTPITV